MRAPSSSGFDELFTCSARFDEHSQVAFFGVDSSVATTTSSACSAVIVGGRPEAANRLTNQVDPAQSAPATR